MSKTTVLGDAIVITSTLTTEEIKTVAKFKPTALALYEGEGTDKVPTFAIGTGSQGSVSKFGITFNGTSRDDKKLATVTIPYTGGENPAEFVAETYGAALAKLNTLEKELPKVVKEAAEAKAAILAGISVQ